MTKQTPLMAFWQVMNLHLADEGLPELTYGQARHLLLVAQMEARAEARMNLPPKRRAA